MCTDIGKLGNHLSSDERHRQSTRKLIKIMEGKDEDLVYEMRSGEDDLYFPNEHSCDTANV